MTITNENKRVSQDGDGANKAFTFNFEVTSTSEVLVIQHDTLLGTDEILTNGTDYDAAIVGTGGTVTIVSGRDAPLATDVITMILDVPFTQELDLVSGAGMNPSSVELALDKVLQNVKRALDISERAMGLLDGSVAGTGIMDALSSRIINVEDPVGVKDATNLQYVSAAILASEAGTFTGTVTVDGAALIAAADHEAQGDLVEYHTGHGSGIIRSIAAKLREIRSVTDFGATGDGVTDDYLAIQRALSSFGAGVGGTLYFPEGKYITTGTLYALAAVRIVGAQVSTASGSFGNGSVIVASGMTGHVIQFEDPTSAYSVEEMGFEATGAVPASFLRFFDPSSAVLAAPIQVKRCSFTGGDTQIQYSDCADIVISSCRFDAYVESGILSAGVLAAGSYVGNVLITGNSFSSTGGTLVSGVMIADGSFVRVADNVFSGGDYGVALLIDIDMDGLSVSGNHFIDQDQGAVNLDQGTLVKTINSVSVTGNTIKNTVNATATAQIYVTDGHATGWVGNVIITGNVIECDADGGPLALVEVRGGSDIIISNNIIDNSSNTDAAIVTGIFCGDQAGDASITGNMIQNMGTNGLRFGVLGSGCHVSDMQNEMTLAEVLVAFASVKNGSMVACTDVTEGADGTAMFTPGVGAGSGSVGFMINATWNWM